MIAPAPAANQVKKKVFVKIGRPGEFSSPVRESVDLKIALFASGPSDCLGIRLIDRIQNHQNP